MGYKKETVRGVFWIGLYRALTRGMSVVRTAILARFLTPNDVGLVAIATILLTFLETLTETGVNTVLIQLKEKIYEYIDTAWSVSIFRGIFISLVVYFGAPYVSLFFNSSDAVGIVRFIALVPLVRGFINPSEVIFQKDLLFHKEFVFRTSLFVVDASVAAITAVLTKSPYAIAYGLLAGAFTEVVISHVFVSPRPKFEFHKARFSFVFSRGKWMTLSGIFDYLFQNADDVLVGRFLGAGALGIYGYAYQLSTLPVTEVSNILSKVTFPVFMKMSEDRRKLWDAFLKTVAAVFLLTSPLAIVLFLFPTEIVHIVLGDKWLAAIPVIRILGFLGMVRSVALTSYAIFLAHRKQEFVTAVAGVGAVVMLILLPVFIPAWGLVGAASSALVGGFAASFAAYYFCSKLSL